MTTPASTLREFFAEMHRWGLAAISNHQQINWETVTEAELNQQRFELRRALTAIYEQYCEAGASAERLQDQGLSFHLDEPEYNPDHPILEERVGAEGTSEIQVGGRDFDFRYHLIQRDGRWWLQDKKEFRSKKGGKWKAHLL